MKDIVAALRWAREHTEAIPDDAHEDAAVFLADESGHPYDWELILRDKGVFRRRLAEAERRLPGDERLQQKLIDARKVLGRRHGL